MASCCMDCFQIGRALHIVSRNVQPEALHQCFGLFNQITSQQVM